MILLNIIMLPKMITVVNVKYSENHFEIFSHEKFSQSWLIQQIQGPQFVSLLTSSFSFFFSHRSFSLHRSLLSLSTLFTVCLLFNVSLFSLRMAMCHVCVVCCVLLLMLRGAVVLGSL